MGGSVPFFMIFIPEQTVGSDGVVGLIVGASVSVGFFLVTSIDGLPTMPYV